MGHKTAKAAHKIIEIEGVDMISNSTAQNWFKDFKGGKLSFETKQAGEGITC